jgi:site-specific DNA-adenine methylase
MPTKSNKSAQVRRALLSEPASSSNRHIARTCGVNKGIVERLRREMTAAGELSGKASAVIRGAEPVRNWRAGFTLLVTGEVVPNDEADWVAAMGGRATSPQREPGLAPPFPYPGGKRKVADLVWSKLGNVENYVEPFAGSLAVLLRRPQNHFHGRHRVETVCDTNHYIVNFWRAVGADPESTAAHADAPVTEADLHARHEWLVRSEEAAAWRERMRNDPMHYDARIAGWWVWGQSCWIGAGWCNPECTTPDNRSRPALNAAWDIGKGVHQGGRVRTCAERRAWLTKWMNTLADRLRQVRVCYRHWSGSCNSESVLTANGTTGVFLDPPYPVKRAGSGDKSRYGSLYALDKKQNLDTLRDEVLAWCQKWGADPGVRVVLCCYEGDGYEPLLASGWTVHSWQASGGYGNTHRKGQGRSENAKRERLLLSPHCPT